MLVSRCALNMSRTAQPTNEGAAVTSNFSRDDRLLSNTLGTPREELAYLKLPSSPVIEKKFLLGNPFPFMSKTYPSIIGESTNLLSLSVALVTPPHPRLFLSDFPFLHRENVSPVLDQGAFVVRPSIFERLIS